MTMMAAQRVGLSWLSLGAVAVAMATTEITPTELPGAEAFVYRTEAPESVRLFVVKPSDWKATDRRPALIFFFGGGWTTGTPQQSIGWARFAARQGMVGIAPDYRTKGRHGTSPHASVADSRAALSWVQSHAAELGIDPMRTVVGGNSAGGHVALWTAITRAPPGSNEQETPPHKPAALILFSTVSDTSERTGYTPQRFGNDTLALSPVHQLDEKMPPVLAFHGNADKLVPLAQAVALRDKLLANGNRGELIIVPGGSHNFDRDLPEWRDKTIDLILGFLEELKLIRRNTAER